MLEEPGIALGVAALRLMTRGGDPPAEAPRKRPPHPGHASTCRTAPKIKIGPNGHRYLLPAAATAAGPSRSACISPRSALEFPSEPRGDGSERADRAGELQLPGRSGPDPGSDDPFAVQQQGNLPARADLERFGRDRPAAAGVAGQVRSSRSRRPAADPGQLRRGGADDHGRRQRDWHEPPGSYRAHRHDRQVRAPASSWPP